MCLTQVDGIRRHRSARSTHSIPARKAQAMTRTTAGMHAVPMKAGRTVGTGLGGPYRRASTLKSGWAGRSLGRYLTASGQAATKALATTAA